MIPAASSLLDGLEAALLEGRLADVRSEAEALEKRLDADALRRALSQNPDSARALSARAERLRAAGQYAAAVAGALSSITSAPPQPYGRGGGSGGEARTRSSWEA